MSKPLILVVEDDNSVKNLITTTLKAHDYRYLTAPNGAAPFWKRHRTILILSYLIYDFPILTVLK